MFTKNNLKYILILALGFFYCSSVYLTQEQYLINYADTNFINIVELLFGSLSMALGILAFSLIYKKNYNIKKIYFIFMILSIISSILFFITKNIYLMGLFMNLTCFFGPAGFGAGYHFSLLGLNVIKGYRGRVFALGYGLASIGTYLLVTLPEKFYSTYLSLFLYIPIVLINLYIVMKNKNLDLIEENNNSNSYKKYFLKLSIIVISMSLLSALCTDAISVFTININGGYGNSRIYYCLGLILSGILVDKKKNIFEILVIVSFIFELIGIFLLKENYSIKIIAGLSYFFIGFFVLFRTMTFINLVDDKKSIIYTCAFGLMYSRIIEGILVLVEDKLINNYLLLIIIISLTLSLVIIIYFLLYFQNKNVEFDSLIKKIVIKYKLSFQEEKVLSLLLKNYSNQEIANELFLSVNTVKNHLSNIYKKTNMKKKELKEKIYLESH